MLALVSVVACLAAQPAVCEVYQVVRLDAETGRPMTFGHCIGRGSQEVKIDFERDRPDWKVQKVRCTPSADPVGDIVKGVPRDV